MTARSNCEGCEFRHGHRGHGEAWTECTHGNAPLFPVRVLWGANETPRPTPKWCPKTAAPDQIVEAVRERLLQRSRAGVAKYGTTLADSTEGPLAWVQHAQEEMMDSANYLERLRVELQNVLEENRLLRLRVMQLEGLQDQRQDDERNEQ